MDRRIRNGFEMLPIIIIILGILIVLKLIFEF
jgi:hypothetical protein